MSSLLDLGMSLNCLHLCHRVVVGRGVLQVLHVLHACATLVALASGTCVPFLLFPPTSLFQVALGCAVILAAAPVPL